MKAEPLSLCINEGIPKIENNVVRQSIAVEAEVSLQAKANGNLENSSITVNKNEFLSVVGSGPLKSILSLSKGCVALISDCRGGL